MFKLIFDSFAINILLGFLEYIFNCGKLTFFYVCVFVSAFSFKAYLGYLKLGFWDCCLCFWWLLLLLARIVDCCYPVGTYAPRVLLMLFLLKREKKTEVSTWWDFQCTVIMWTIKCFVSMHLKELIYFFRGLRYCFIIQSSGLWNLEYKLRYFLFSWKGEWISFFIFSDCCFGLCNDKAGIKFRWGGFFLRI